MASVGNGGNTHIPASLGAAVRRGEGVVGERPVLSHGDLSEQNLLAELAYIKALFQLRTIEAVIRGPEYPSQRAHRRKVHAVARQLRHEAGLPADPRLA